MASDPIRRKLSAILAADIVGYSRLAGADEERTLARLRALRGDLIDPAVAAHHGRVVKRMGDGVLAEFRSAVDAVRCAVEMQGGMVERNAGVTAERRIEFRIGIHVGDVVEEADGDLMGDGVNIAARLEGIAQPGGICLSNAAYEQVRDRIKEPFTDLGERKLKNIARPVRIFAISSHPVPPREESGESSSRPASPPSREKDEPPRLSIVVLPFANIGGDREQDYFVDGVTESLTTDLSRMAGSFVIGRNTAFTYKNKAVDLKQIGRDLGVRYVLEGSVQRGGNRMRVNVQLIDADNGVHLWAERFDKPVTDLFDMQDEIVARHANILNTELITAEARRAERSPSPDSMDLYFQGMAWMNKGVTPDYMAQAHGFFERALALDAGNLEALVGMATTDALAAANFMSGDHAPRFAAAEAATAKVLSIAPNHAMAHYIFGLVLTYTGRAAQGIAEFERALALDGNLAGSHGAIGLAKYFTGRAEDTEAHVREALRLSPRDSWAYMWMEIAGIGKLAQGEDEAGIAWFRRSLEINRNNPMLHFLLSGALSSQGGHDEARRLAQDGLALNPAFTVSRFRDAVSALPAYRAAHARIAAGMIAAGVPEG